MTRRSTSDAEEPLSKRRPATTPEGRELQLISAAVDLAEKQILAGTASSQVISHYLKLGSSREALEQEKIRGEVYFNKVKAENLESQQKMEELYAQALAAMTSYQGRDPVDDGFDEGDETYDD